MQFTKSFNKLLSVILIFTLSFSYLLIIPSERVNAVGDDYGNDVSGAASIDLSTQISGLMDYSGDIDYFKFVAPCDGLYNIQSSGYVDLLGELLNLVWDSSINGYRETSLASDGYYDTSKKNFSITAELQKGKIYGIKISNYTILQPGETGPYSFKAVLDDYKNTIATFVNTGIDIQGRIDYEGDIDYFRFSPSDSSKNGYYIIETTGSTDTIGEYSDYITSGDGDSYGIGNNFCIKTAYVYSVSNYFIKVKARGTGNYTLNIRYIGTSSTTTDADLYSAAIQVSDGTIKSGSINRISDIDYYKIIPSTSDIYNFPCSGTSYVQPYTQVFDSNGVKKNFDDSNASAYLEANQIYYIRVGNSNTTGTGSYTLSVTKWADYYNWYYTSMPDGLGGTIKVYFSDLGVNNDDTTFVNALVAYNNDTQGKVYLFDNGAWRDSGSYAALPGTGGLAAVTTNTNPSSVSSSVYSKTYESSTYKSNTYNLGTLGTSGNVFSIDFEKLKIDVANKILSQIGMTLLDLEPEEEEMFLKGVAVGLDDNYFFSLFQVTGQVRTYYDDHHFVVGKILVDSISTVFWAGMTADAAASAAAAFATATAEATAGGLAAATGVGIPGGVALEGAAAAAVVDGAVCTVVSIVAAKAAVKSKGFLEYSKSRLSSTTNHSKKLRQNLQNDTINGMQDPGWQYAAHHIIASGAEKAARARDKLVRILGMNIDDAVNGVFLPRVRGIGGSAYHPELHTQVYYDRVNGLFDTVNTTGEAINMLKYIRQELLNGTFPH